MAELEPMMLDDAVVSEPAIVTKDVDGVPYCAKHHCRMEQKSGGKKGSAAAYFGCPVPGCTETAKRIKTSRETVVPSSPQLCPRCSTDKKPVYCERDNGVSTAASVVLKCPECGWKSNALAVPQLAAAMSANRKPHIHNIGDR